MDAQAIGRRIRAARAIAGFHRIDDLARQLEDAGETGLSGKTLGNIERGDREPKPRELRVIAEACGVPYEFLTEPLDRMARPEGRVGLRRLEAVEDRLAEIDRKIDRLVDALDRLGGTAQFDALLAWLEEEAAKRPGAGARESGRAPRRSARGGRATDS